MGIPQIPPPGTWDDFEALCLELWKAEWKDLNAQRHGRKGQAQQGVDISGRIDGNGSPAGVQCKWKDVLVAKWLTEQELLDEVEKAKTFVPPLSEFIIATAGPRDAPLQEKAREITEAHLKTGLFRVFVFSWDDIRELLEARPDILRRHFPQFFETVSPTVADQLKAVVQEALAAQTGPRPISVPARETELAPGAGTVVVQTLPEDVNTEYQAELDQTKGLIQKHQAQAALAVLKPLKERVWAKGSASPPVKFRILTQIGSAALTLRDDKTAGQHFIEAFQYNPDDEKALANVALGWFLMGEPGRVNEFIEKLIAKNPANPTAYSVRLQCAEPKEPVTKLLEGIPVGIRESPEVAYALAFHAQRLGDTENAVRWLEAADRADSDANPEIDATLAQALLDHILRQTPKVRFGVIGPAESKALTRAVTLLTSAWDAIKNSDLPKHRTAWLVNRGIAYKLLGEREKSRADIDAALRISPDDPNHVKWAAISAFEAGDKVVALELLSKIAGNPSVPDAGLLFAELVKGKEPAKSEAILKNLRDKAEEPWIKQEASYALVELYIEARRFADAELLIQDQRSTNPTDILTLVLAANLSSAKGQQEAAIALLKEAKSYVSETTSDKERARLADAFYSKDLFPEAAALYGSFVDSANDNPMVRRLLFSLYRAGESARALELCRRLSALHPLKYAVEIEASILEDIGAIAGARTACETFLKREADLEVRLRLAVINYRDRKLDEVDAFLLDTAGWQNLSLQSAFLLAYLLVERGRIAEALDVAYETRRRDFSKSNAHLKYVGIFMRAEKERGELLSAERIADGCAAYYEAENGEKGYYVLEDREDVNVLFHEIPPSEPIAKELLGKKAGDEFVLRKDAVRTVRARIAEVVSKHVAAYRATLEDFEKLFPGVPGLWKFSFDPSKKDAEGVPAGFEEITKQIKDQRRRAEKVLEFYKAGQLTIGALAEIMGRGAIKVFGGLTTMPEIGVRCSIGSQAERDGAHKRIKEEPFVVVVDVFSLLTFSALEALDILAGLPARRCMAQSTIDLLENEIVEQSVGREGHKTLAATDDERIAIGEVTAEEVKKHVETLQALVAWARKNCEILPCHLALSMNSEEKERLDEMLGSSFVDSMLIAKEIGGLLLSEDERLRSLAQNSHGVAGIWAQALLINERDKGRLDRARYDALTIRLARSNFYHTTIDAEVLIEAARKSEWRTEGDFAGVARLLSGPHCDPQSAAVVAVNFFYALWKEQLLGQKRDFLILALLNQVMTGRDRREMIELLSRATARRFVLLPIVQQRLTQIIGAWRGANLI